jgi:hypothetical protein
MARFGIFACALIGCASSSTKERTAVLEKIGTPGKENVSVPDKHVIEKIRECMVSNPEPVFYEIGVGIGAPTLAAAQLMNNKGNIVIFSRAGHVRELSNDLGERGYTNVDGRWGSPRNTYSGYHFELARGFVDGDLPPFDVAYVDGGHVFHLDAPAACVLKELCKPGGYILFDDWWWSLAKSRTMNPANNEKTARDYDVNQIEACHVQLVCKALMNTDKRFEFIALKGGTAIYRRRSL